MAVSSLELNILKIVLNVSMASSYKLNKTQAFYRCRLSLLSAFLTAPQALC